ncbi:MAG TPA: long-chain fatty acid--CoA ligase [Clostridiaceae bacterium]|jgi:long-chain acyl-CoA synthetase|nr:long-chain fatty acid--CoA ligase [Clostridiaceae bacterium]
MKNAPLYEVRKIRDLRDMLDQSVKIFRDKTAFLIKKGRGEAYTSVSYKEFGDDVNAFGTSLTDLNGLGSRVAILAETRYEWNVTYLATTNGAGVIIPLDKELNKLEIANLMNRSHADILVYSGSKQPLIDEISAEIPSVKHFICMDRLPEKSSAIVFADLLDKGRKLLEDGNRAFLDAPIDVEATNILLFTSGTTAQSKAVMLSHRNICVNLEGMCSMVYIDPSDVFLSILPLHHTYECTCGFLCPIYRGATVAHCEGLRYITQNMKEAKATVILAVPLMLEMFHRAIMKKALGDKKTAKKFKFGIKLTRALRKIGIDKRRKIFSAIHDSFGGHLRMLISGGAGIDPQILADMQNMGFLCLQGYGLTECAPILALNRDVFFNDNAAGLALPGVDIRIIDKDENGIGEIIGKGPNVMLGYYENEEATKEAIDSEGFFHTGDLGYLDADGFVIITGRKKNVIISKNGKNIFPEEIESLLSRSEYVAESLVSGEDNQHDDIIVTATIFPNQEAITDKFGPNPDPDMIQQVLEEECKKVNDQLPSYKQIRKVIYRDTEFEKTTSKKIKRSYK